jgi:hypothetical protein
VERERERESLHRFKDVEAERESDGVVQHVKAKFNFYLMGHSKQSPPTTTKSMI